MPRESPELSRGLQSRVTTGGQALGFRSTQVPPPATPARSSQFQTAPRWQRVTRLRSPSRSHTDTHRHTHTHTHTLAALARARGTTRTSQSQTHARTPGPAEFCISSSSELLLAFSAAPLCSDSRAPEARLPSFSAGAPGAPPL